MNLLVFCSFDEFLMDMKQSKRKNIRQERKKVGLVPPKHCFIHTYYERLNGHEKIHLQAKEELVICLY